MLLVGGRGSSKRLVGMGWMLASWEGVCALFEDWGLEGWWI